MPEQITTQCCVVGAGPAGMVLSVMLARAGVDVLLLEKHGDFLRDFRGDTLHPSSMDVLDELGFLDELMDLPVDRAPLVEASSAGVQVTFADFRHLPTRARYLAFLPQWDFLTFLQRKGEQYPTFELRMSTRFTGLIEQDGRVVGARAEGPDGPVEIRSKLVVGTDGRHSAVRTAAELPLMDLAAPFDVFWFRLPRKPEDPDHVLGRFEAGRLIVLFNRGTTWQVAYVMPKGGYDEVVERGLEWFKATIAETTSLTDGRIEVIESWDDVPFLTVRMDRLLEWHRPGLLCIGDAAHAMSAIGGIGINVAIHDAVAAANQLALPLREDRLTDRHLHRVQRRRELPTRFYQGFQRTFQKRVITSALGNEDPTKPIPTLRVARRFPAITRLTGRMIGIGFRPEHVDAPVHLPPDERARP